MVEILYSQSRAKLQPGQTFRNPRFFTGVEEGASKVLLDGDWPKVAEAYAKAGVEVVRVDPQVVEGPAYELPPHEASAVVIPDDWRDLPWNAPDEGGPSLRALGGAVRGTPVVSKADAAEAIEAELAKRG